MRLMRKEQGKFATLYKHLRDDPQLFHQYARMDLEKFQALVEKLGPRYGGICQFHALYGICTVIGRGKKL